MPRVFQPGRPEGDILLPEKGQDVVVWFDDDRASGEVRGVVKTATYDGDDWPKTYVEFENGSYVHGFTAFRVACGLDGCTLTGRHVHG